MELPNDTKQFSDTGKSFDVELIPSFYYVSASSKACLRIRIILGGFHPLFRGFEICDESFRDNDCKTALQTKSIGSIGFLDQQKLSVVQTPSLIGSPL